MIEAIAARDRKKAKLPKHLPLDFANLIAHHRADRARTWLQMRADNNYQVDLQMRAELENQLNERQRMEDRLRIEGLPAHATHPLAAVVVGAPVAMEVDMVHLDSNDNPLGARLPPAPTEAVQLAALLVPDHGLLNDGRLARNLPVLTQAERTARLNLRNARAFPELIASGNAKLRLRMDPVAPV
jgi:hypothetical protein